MSNSRHPELPGADFDHHGEAWLKDPWSIWRGLRESESLGHSERHGGFYIASQYADVVAIARDTEHFTNTGGAQVPPTHTDRPFPPEDFDPPEHREYRKLINPYF